MDTKPRPAAPQPLAGPSAVFASGDERWAQRTATWRERELALPWPQDVLENFTLRMFSHGMCVSRAMMLCDRSYALQQLVHAHCLADDTLRLMAVQLFRYFESRPSGASGLH